MHNIRRAFGTLPELPTTEAKTCLSPFGSVSPHVSRAQFPSSVFPGFFAWEGHLRARLLSFRALVTGGGTGGAPRPPPQGSFWAAHRSGILGPVILLQL